jgi:hypothetical protein
MLVRFTQAQVRKILDLPPETFRHWRKVLPPLANRARRTPFSHGDLVALAAIRELVRGTGVNSSALAPYAGAIFTLCNDRPWPALARCRLQINGNVADLVSIRAALPMSRRPIVLLSLGPLVGELGQSLLGTESSQRELKFPLTAVRRQRR